jgi:putative peptide zinc metalloprotease protein
MLLGSKRRQFSSVRSKGLRCPKLRGDLNISQQTMHSKLSYVIKLPGESSYFRFGPLEFEILSLCDGTRTPADLAAQMTARNPSLALTESHVIDFLDTVEPPLWEKTRQERHLAVLERIREGQKARVDHSSLLNIRFPPWNPDRFLALVNRYSGWVFTRSFVFASVALFLITLYLLGSNWSRIVEDTEALYSFEGRTSYDIFSFWILLLALEAIHEFGHGLVCKHFGGEVPETGFSLVYFTPSIYTDTTDMLLLNRRQRYWVIFAGIWIELLVCGLATLVWAFTLPGTFLNDFAYKTLLLSGIETILWNFNPLIQADGYYALAEHLGIDNLAESSQKYLSSWFHNRFFSSGSPLPVVSSREHRIFLAFSLSSLANNFVLLAVSLLFLHNILSEQFGIAGYSLTVAILLFSFRRRIATLFTAAANTIAARRELPMTWKSSPLHRVIFFAVLVLFLIPPFPFHVTSDVVLEPAKRLSLRPKVDGILGDVFVHEGDAVTTGQLLAVLQNPELEADDRILSTELALASSNLRATEFQYDPSLTAQASRDRSRLQTEFAVAHSRKEALEIRAPADGTIATPLLEQKRGQFLSAGEEFCQIVNRSSLRARLLVHDWDFQDVKSGAAVKLKFEALAFKTYSGTVDRILPAAASDRPLSNPDKPHHLGQDLTNYLALVVTVPNSDGLLRENMTGTAKIAGKSYPLAWLVFRGAWRWFRNQVF